MNIQDHILECKRTTMSNAQEYNFWCTIRIKDIRRIEQVDSSSDQWPDDKKERVYLLTENDGLFVYGNYKELNKKWIEYMEVNGIE